MKDHRIGSLLRKTSIFQTWVVFALGSGLSGSLSAATFGKFTYTDNGTSITITDYPTNEVGTVNIPSTINSKPVTAIGDRAFNLCQNITQVTVPSSVTTIGNNAFDSCSNLATISIPQGVISIGHSAFWYCRKLASITIPSSITSIGAMSFYNCSSLTTIDVDEANEVYSSMAGVLFNKQQTILIAYPPGKTGSYDVPYGVTSIGDQAFYFCKGPTSVIIPSTLQSIGSSAFAFCSSLISFDVDAANPVYSSADGIMYNKTQTAILIYPSGKAGAYTIPSTITSLGQSAFAGCSGLTSVTIPNTIATIPQFAFNGCSSLSNVVIPNNVTTIEAWAFRACSGLTTATVSSSVTSMPYLAFQFCEGLASIDVDAANPVFSSLDGVVYDKQFTTLRICPQNKAGHFTIAPGITAIAGSAFSRCSKLTSLTVPSSVTSIGDYAFDSCYSMTAIYFQGSAPILGGLNVFYSDSSLNVYYLPTTTGWSSTFGGRPTVPISALNMFHLASGLPSDGTGDFLTPAGDGVPNIYKFAFNMVGAGPGQATTLFIPNAQRVSASGTAGLPSADYGSTEMRLEWTYIRRKASTSPGITYLVEFADDLASPIWAVNSSATESVTDIDADFERVTLTDSVANAGKRFSRVRVTVP